MIAHIKIDKPRDYLIVEKTDGEIFLAGSNVYCGCCGKSIGTMRDNLSMPFTPKTFLDHLDNSSVSWMVFGLSHKYCRHTMFTFQKYFDFIRLNDYYKQTLNQ